MAVVEVVDPRLDEVLDDMAVLTAVMPELAIALQAQASLSANLLARLEASAAEGDRRMAELGLTPR